MIDQENTSEAVPPRGQTRSEKRKAQQGAVAATTEPVKAKDLPNSAVQSIEFNIEVLKLLRDNTKEIELVGTKLAKLSVKFGVPYSTAFATYEAQREQFIQQIILSHHMSSNKEL